MRLFKSSIERIKSGNIRVEEDLTNIIDEFFSNQPNIEKYEIVEKKNIKDILNQENELTGIAGELKWVMDVYGDVHLYEEDLINGDLCFKIRMLTGNLYCHCKHNKPSVIPTKLYGEIVFVPDEEEQWKNRQTDEEADDLNMGYITAQSRTKEDLITNVKLAFADLISRSATEGIDLDELWKEVLAQNSNKDKYKLRIEFKKNKLGKTITNIYVSNDDKDKLELNPIQTAIYLMFVMNENGFTVDDLNTTDWIVAKQIYSQLARTEQKTYIKDKKTGEYLNYTDGILNKAFLPSTVNGYISEIRKKLEKLISIEDIRNGFSIGGNRGKAFMIRQSTPQIREQICEEFGFD